MPPFQCWIHFNSDKDELTFRDITNYNRLIPLIRESKQLGLGDGPIYLYANKELTEFLDPEHPVNTTTNHIYLRQVPASSSSNQQNNIINLKSNTTGRSEYNVTKIIHLPATIMVPTHPEPLKLYENALNLYDDGYWTCDICNSDNLSPDETFYHSQNEFDICLRCYLQLSK
ncbi:hypothetical protein PPL_05066 [Heterostelium album PN500]|uniref:Uncharacterized protein n=1 Tax=Heterostelium pallidum (strain ATCC 26659 / Pp 5 / PN500) TaxID=670386 RepID=D3B9C2_HETP5|nr:hypothetical protein PPL_05066 [Heterostelium album PN500]EFA81834.1 hypothetical protein PPL_05066 [Heterostelium album PN500]|eukprot:XP_020433951.1 hypothetical protein PPL_05066 [Heterostelium album PN500]